MKKLFSFTFVVLLAFSFLLIGLNKNVNFVLASERQSKASYLIDYNSKTVISKNNCDERLQIASMTKIMLLLLIYENENVGNINFNDKIIVSETASKMGGSQVFLESGGEYQIGELVKSICVASANDASVAMAETLFGSEEECVKEMNKKAEELGLKNTQYVNCTGLPKPMQYSSAKDTATILCELLKYEKYFNYSNVWMDKIQHEKSHTEISNTNKLIRHYEGCDGGKTGFTQEAGFCLAATAKRGNMRLVGVVIGSPSSKSRFKEVSDMFNYGFNNYSNKCVIDSSKPIEQTLKVNCGVKNFVEVVAEENFYVFSKRNAKENITVEYEISPKKAPIKKGDVVGVAEVYKDGVLIGKVNLISNESSNKLSYGDYVLKIIKEMA